MSDENDDNDNLISFDRFKQKQQEAEEALYLQEARNLIAGDRQGNLLIVLHYLIEEERKYNVLTTEEIVEVINILARQIKDGIIIPPPY